MAKLDDYFLEESKSKKDRKTEIEEKLCTFGICILGAGTYYVSGITMPDGSTLTGLGDCSRIVLLDEVKEGFAVVMKSHCTVKDLSIRGSVENALRPEEVGTRHGIGFLGDAVKSEDGVRQARDSIIEGCRIDSFTGGGITCKDTGFSVECSLCVSNCRIHRCGAGINISHFSEYHKFTGVDASRNLYGCINNGGNNVFCSCSFDGNKIGYLIDNSKQQSKNNAHGSCVACTFNHSDQNRGIGIQIIGSNPGYVFSACQLFFSKIVVEDSRGIQFNNFNCGKNIEVFVKSGGVVSFFGCLFTNTPTFTVENSPHFKMENCFTKSGTPICATQIEKEEGSEK